MSLTILVPKVWRTVDKVLARQWPRRPATVPPAAWLSELMERRMGAIMVCSACVWRYGDWIARLGYAKHPDIRSKGGRCDGCKASYDVLPIWIAEEKRGRAEITRRDLDAAHRRRLAPVPEGFGA